MITPYELVCPTVGRLFCHYFQRHRSTCFFRLIPVPGDGLANQADQPCQTGQLGPAGPATGHSSIAGQTGQMGQPRPAGQAGHQAMPAIFSLKAGPHSLRKEIHLIGDIQNLSSMLTS